MRDRKSNDLWANSRTVRSRTPRSSWMILAAIAALILALTLVEGARAHYKPGTHNAVHAIQQAWCGKANVSCRDSRTAVAIAKCEAAYWWTWGIPAQARGPNDEYGNPRLSMFQMGTRERRLYGHGPDPWSQARAAHRYFLVSGWWPWQASIGCWS